MALWWWFPSQCKEDWKIDCLKELWTDLIQSQCKEDWKVFSIIFSAWFLFCLNAKRIERSRMRIHTGFKSQKSQCKEDWKILILQAISMHRAFVSMQRGLKAEGQKLGTGNTGTRLNAKRIERDRDIKSLPRFGRQSQCKEDWKWQPSFNCPLTPCNVSMQRGLKDLQEKGRQRHGCKSQCKEDWKFAWKPPSRCLCPSVSMQRGLKVSTQRSVFSTVKK